MHVFIAGGTGVIGRRLVPLLVAAGHRVTGSARTVDGARRLRSLGAAPVVVDVFDRDALITAVRAARPDAAVHQLTALSGGSSVANADMRVRGTRYLVDAALAAGTRRIVAQSIAWAYAPGPSPATECDALDPDPAEPRSITVNGVRALETTAAELPEAVVLRYGTLYGPGTWYAHDGSVAEQARTGELVADESITSFLHVADAAAACCLALEWPTGTVNVCDDEPAPGSDWAPAFARSVGAPPPQPQPGRPGWARGADNRFARRSLGWSPQFPSWRLGSHNGL
jgi:nucleoside-diphosphate-sugar epimerase